MCTVNKNRRVAAAVHHTLQLNIDLVQQDLREQCSLGLTELVLLIKECCLSKYIIGGQHGI